jgi:hypothetical protein
MNKNNNTLSWRVGELEANYKSLDTRFDKLMENDLPHIKTEIVGVKGGLEVLNTRLKYSLIANAVQIVALVIGVVLLLRR